MFINIQFLITGSLAADYSCARYNIIVLSQATLVLWDLLTQTVFCRSVKILTSVYCLTVPAPNTVTILRYWSCHYWYLYYCILCFIVRYLFIVYYVLLYDTFFWLYMMFYCMISFLYVLYVLLYDIFLLYNSIICFIV